MSKISNLIFNGAEHYMTSGFGMRTLNGKPNNHTGVDYGTNGKKLPQYAIENGYILSCGRDFKYGGAKYVWVVYPRINKKMLHYHLDSYSISKGQKVVKGTLIGYTGQTGFSKGIHLHLGMKDLTTDKYEDVEKYSENYHMNPYNFVPYVRAGSKGESVKAVQWALNQKGYNLSVDGNIFTDGSKSDTIKAIKHFQENHGLKPDGVVGYPTFNKLME